MRGTLRMIAVVSGYDLSWWPISESSTGSSTKPFRIPNNVSIANTAKKYLQKRTQMKRIVKLKQPPNIHSIFKQYMRQYGHHSREEGHTQDFL